MRNRSWGIVAVVALVIAACGGVTSEASGPGEGIQVHGDWTIDIYNEDGSLDEHLEFSNHLTDGGAGIIAQALVDGLVLESPGISPSWGIVLGDLGGLGFTGESPCNSSYPLGSFPSTHMNPAAFLTEACFLSVTPELLGPPGNEIRLTGSVIADKDGTIDHVETTISVAVAVTGGIPVTVQSDIWSLTRNGEPPLPVENIVAGQSIQVEVLISFTSG